jgi:hypothetical protein
MIGEISQPVAGSTARGTGTIAEAGAGWAAGDEVATALSLLSLAALTL